MVLFRKVLLDFICEHLLGHCGLKIAVVKFVYPIFFQSNHLILWVKLFSSDFYPVSYNV